MSSFSGWIYALLDFVILRTYVPRRVKSKGLVHCLVSLTLLTISVKLGSSVAYRLPKWPNRLASARRVSIFGKRITLDHEMRI